MSFASIIPFPLGKLLTTALSPLAHRLKRMITSTRPMRVQKLKASEGTAGRLKAESSVQLLANEREKFENASPQRSQRLKPQGQEEQEPLHIVQSYATKVPVGSGAPGPSRDSGTSHLQVSIKHKVSSTRTTTSGRDSLEGPQNILRPVAQLEKCSYQRVGFTEGCTPFLACLKNPENVTDLHPARRPWVNVCGAVTRSDSNAATFTIDTEQYTSAFADQAKLAADDAKKAAEKKAMEEGTYNANIPSNAAIAFKSVFPVVGYIPDSPRYKSKKPTPWVKKFVSFGGYLTGVTSSLEGETLQERFHIEVDNIVFLGSFTPLAATPATSASTSSVAGSSGSRKKARFSSTKRGRDDEDDGTPSSPSPFVGTQLRKKLA
ncbi:hypothetical protein B0H14DRAFT_2601615 [Mycena olivaceomarginata]|nr:hypothetical protein B0H14DRAFT_2601615 [Mycena olivaceomarginata]